MLSIWVVNSILLWIVVLLNLLLTIALIGRFNDISKHMSAFTDIDVGLEKGSLAPDFLAQTLTGETVTLADYARKVVSFIFISPHCSPCLEKIPKLNALAAKAKQAGVEILLVNTDGDKAETAAFVKKHNVALPVLIAPSESNSFASDYKAEATPSYCILNQDSHVAAAGMFGPGWEEQLTLAWATA
ncbi:MAG: TlpA family protein disulfide reductase [Cyanomargarita calcarea GSE-NOS-MK-12-04C]|jgi:peroxiredoxin|uniref:TlpA family protein disulfide reductase n=1 Tax=Cyanomargarita calcarea GSE-NOS-MK-12-04C TaxID=2839659 RepID=A0A951QJW9_9CYAN|nr:TlpA family protein disulfide reductase [Cyanomargarita calcarea GSE-NOS-MK-12-04C]